MSLINSKYDFSFQIRFWHSFPFHFFYFTFAKDPVLVEIFFFRLLRVLIDLGLLSIFFFVRSLCVYWLIQTMKQMWKKKILCSFANGSQRYYISAKPRERYQKNKNNKKQMGKKLKKNSRIRFTKYLSRWISKRDLVWLYISLLLRETKREKKIILGAALCDELCVWQFN